MHNNENTKKAKLLSKTDLRAQLRLVGSLSRTGMNAGNKGDFESAFGNIEDALFLAKELNKECLVAKLLNNLGILHTQKGAWDKALLSYEQSMDIVVHHHGTQNYLYKTLQKNISYLFSMN